MPNIQIGNKVFNYTQERQKRKTISIALKSCNEILIKTPHRTSVKEVCSILQRYAGWISKKALAYEKLSCNAPINDNYILYRGEKFIIKRCFETSMPSVKLIDKNVVINCGSSLFPPLNDIFISWYKAQAKNHLTQRTVFWAEKMHVFVARIAIHDQKTRWGSCSTRHNINYNWRIMMAASEVIDYLVIHETAHLLQMNHSAKFWQIVEKYDPLFKEHRLWLRQNGDVLLNVLR